MDKLSQRNIYVIRFLILVVHTLIPAIPVIVAGWLAFSLYDFFGIGIIAHASAYALAYFVSLFFCIRSIKRQNLKAATINTAITSVLNIAVFLLCLFPRDSQPHNVKRTFKTHEL
ncbi:MAG TPA: hypothetical protein PK513_09875 [Alphaproteobacteria bacterium]|nr:MAG: hypothetical protein H6859_04350 [Rhodospirillales bacterium]HOO82799.1 hypothetical protein [Alphaproteobacteria bacterium]